MLEGSVECKLAPWSALGFIVLGFVVSVHRCLVPVDLCWCTRGGVTLLLDGGSGEHRGNDSESFLVLYKVSSRCRRQLSFWWDSLYGQYQGTVLSNLSFNCIT